MIEQMMQEFDGTVRPNEVAGDLELILVLSLLKTNRRTHQMKPNPTQPLLDAS
jgi:hypothetical protein